MLKAKNSNRPILLSILNSKVAQMPKRKKVELAMIMSNSSESTMKETVVAQEFQGPV